MNKSNMRKAILSQIYILRAQVDTIIAMIEELESNEDQKCLHPKEQRINLTTMGGPEKWVCKICGYEYEEGKN